MKTYLMRLQFSICLVLFTLLQGCSSGSGSGSGASGGGTTTSATLSVTGVSPAKVQAGAADLTLTISGTGFQQSTQLQIGSAAVTATYVSSTQMTATLPAKSIANGAMLSIVASNGSTSSATANAVSLEVDNPAPQVTGFTPTSLMVGSGSSTMTVTGTGFVPSSVVQLNGTSRATGFGNSGQLTFTLTDADLASGGTLNLTVFNSTPGGGTSSASSVPVAYPIPGAITVSPSAILAGAASAAKTITVTGSGFVAGSVAQVNGSARATTVQNSSQLTFDLTAADQTATGTLAITVANPTPGGGVSSSAAITVTNPVPGALTLSPASVVTGNTSVKTITVTGSNFVPGSVVMFKGSARPTTVISNTQLTFDLTVADQATASATSVTVVNAAPGGGTSTAATLTVAAPAQTPVLTSVTPASLLVGSPNSTITLLGSNLTSSCQYLWNSTALTFSIGSTLTYVNGVYTTSPVVYASVPASLMATTDTASITAKCPLAPTPVSNALTVSVTDPPAPTITSINPAAGPIGTDQKITFTGTSFTANSKVSFNGITLPTTYTSSGQLTATLPAKNNVLPGIGSFTVTTPAPGGGTSSSVAFTSYVALVNNDVVYNPANGLFYASVPSSAGTPYGNSIVSIDPVTGTLGTPIPVGSEPNRLAITADGKYLWVGIDGANAVRKVDLVNGVAGLQFAIPQQTGNSVGNSAAYALAALPGATDSVVVSNANFPSYLGIYDAGVLRGSNVGSYYTQPYVILADGTKNEIYTSGYNGYQTFTYSSSGLTLKATGTGGFSVQYGGDMQVSGGNVYPSNGKVYDAESGALQGTLYLSGSTPASGSTVADDTLGKIFVLDIPSNYSFSNSYQVQVFNSSDYTSNTAIPLTVANTPDYSTPRRLTRWGANGLAFRTSGGLYSFRSNLIKDLSGTSADLGVTVTSSGTSTGSPVTFTVQVKNNGSAAATNVGLAALLPTNGVLLTATPTVGSCATVSTLACNLGSLANGDTATVTVSIHPVTAGDITLGVQVSGSENDSVSTNNSATATATVAGADYNATPMVSSISPAAIKAGSADTTVTINGTGFNGNSSVKLGSTVLTANLVSSTQMTATVPAGSLMSMGWAPITVANPTPGGGTSAPVALTVFNVITAGVNDLAYEPYSRKVFVSVGSGSSTMTGNSIAQLTPETGSFNTPVNIGSQPTRLALSSNGKYLYSTLSGANSIARFNIATNAKEFTFSPTLPTNYYSSTSGFSDVVVQPGSETLLAVNYSYYSGVGLVDVDVANQKGVLRGSSTTSSYSSYPTGAVRFLDANNLFVFDGSLEKYTVSSAGLSYNTVHTGTYMQSFGSFMLSGKYAFADAGGFADISGNAPVQLGTFRPVQSTSYTSNQKVAGDAGLGRVFIAEYTGTYGYSSYVDGIVAYDPKTYMPTTVLPLGMATIEGNSSFSVNSLIRWGQDGLAMLTSTGHVYLLRGPVVVPGLLGASSAATLTGASSTTVVHGADNLLLTVTGTNFQPGVAVNWNGSYRTTTIVDATHVTVAIPASDLANAGSATLTAVNPGAAASGGLTFTIQ